MTPLTAVVLLTWGSVALVLRTCRELSPEQAAEYQRALTALG
ncbi:MAG: hypothetical protein ACRDTC_06245 [Pseudonocardiaceae bacterium]